MDERLDLAQLADFVWKRRGGLLIATLLAGGISFAVAFFQPPVYESSSQVLLLSPVADIRKGEAQYELTMKTYLELIRGGEVLRRAVGEVKGAANLEEMDFSAVRLDVRNLAETRVIVLSVRAPKPRAAALVADASARKFIELCQTIRTREIAGKRSILEAELEALEKEQKEARGALANQLAGTSYQTRSDLLLEIEGLRSLLTETRWRLQKGAQAEEGPPAHWAAPPPAEKRLALLLQRLVEKRELFDSIEAQDLKVEELEESHRLLSQQMMTLGFEINQRLGHAIQTAQAPEPFAPAGLSASKIAFVGAASALVLAISLLLLWAMATGEHIPVTGRS